MEISKRIAASCAPIASAKDANRVGDRFVSIVSFPTGLSYGRLVDQSLSNVQAREMNYSSLQKLLRNGVLSDNQCYRADSS